MDSLDIVLIIYIFGVVVSTYGFLLFSWWWWSVGAASDVFIFVALLFAFNALSDAIALYSRVLSFESPAAMVTFHATPIWLLRRVPELAILAIFSLKMTHRALGVRRRAKEAGMSLRVRRLSDLNAELVDHEEKRAEKERRVGVDRRSGGDRRTEKKDK